IFHFDFNIIK
ncbi:hypothetical protein DERP_010948, partial [Dermatophagoides pteronyssinus]